MQRVASSTCGSGKALVGQAPRQAVQVPQCEPVNGSSGSNSRSVSSAPRKKKLPRRGLISIVFLPIQPSPARRAKSRSKSGAVAAEVVHLAGEAAIEPVGEVRKSVGVRGGSDAGEGEPARAGLGFQTRFERLHTASLATNAKRSAPLCGEANAAQSTLTFPP